MSSDAGSPVRSTILPHQPLLESVFPVPLEFLPAKTRAAKKGIVFKYTITFGSPVEHVTNISKSKKIDLIVIGAHGKGRIKELFLGSVSNAILHKSRVPVMIVK